MRRGHPGEFFYIIFSGSAFVNIQDRDKAGRTFTRTECVMEQGALFGVRGGDTGRLGGGEHQWGWGERDTNGSRGRETLVGVGGERH